MESNTDCVESNTGGVSCVESNTDGGSVWSLTLMVVLCGV